MIDAKFTPGPWVLVGRFNDKIYHEASDTVVAQTWYPGASCKSPSPTDVMKANARLIAAAPDMYSVLKALVENIEEYDGFVALGDIVDAKAAIAKAEGKS